MQAKKSMKQVFKERIEQATNIGQLDAALYSTVYEFIEQDDEREAFIYAFASQTLTQDTKSLKEWYIHWFNQACDFNLDKEEDEKAITFFADLMRDRFAESRDVGWKDTTSVTALYRGFLKAVTELRYVDVANYAMMLEYHKRVYGNLVEKSFRLLDELDEAIAYHNKVKFAVSNPPLSLGIQAAREKILREVEHDVYMTASNAINAIVQAGTKNRSDPATVGSVARARELLSKLLKE